MKGGRRTPRTDLRLWRLRLAEYQEAEPFPLPGHERNEHQWADFESFRSDLLSDFADALNARDAHLPPDPPVSETPVRSGSAPQKD